MIWSYAQRLKQNYDQEGRKIAVYAHAMVALNGGSFKPLIDNKTDLANVPWERFKHSDWILYYQDYD